MFSATAFILALHAVIVLRTQTQRQSRAHVRRGAALWIAAPFLVVVCCDIVCYHSTPGRYPGNSLISFAAAPLALVRWFGGLSSGLFLGVTSSSEELPFQPSSYRTCTHTENPLLLYQSAIQIRFLNRKPEAPQLSRERLCRRLLPESISTLLATRVWVGFLISE